MKIALCENTGYSSPSELKKLDFIFSSLRKYIKKHPKSIEILEIGCGKGNISIPLASLGYNIVGVDINKETISYLKRKNPFENASFFVGDAENISITQKFDVVICSEVFEHLQNPRQLSASLKRLVKTSGIIIITIPNGYGPWELFYDLPVRFALRLLNAIRKNQAAQGSSHVQNYTIQSFRKILECQEISIKELHRSDFISGVPVVRKSWLAQYDTKIADKLPYWLVSGWYLICTQVASENTLHSPK